MAVLISVVSTTCGVFFAGKYDDRRLQNKERITVLIAMM